MKGYNELVKLVNMSAATGGLDVTNEAICEYQDMIGHSSIEQLNELANGPQRETFYRVYGVAYGTIAAIKFYCENSRKLAEIIEEHEEAALDAEERADKAEEEAKRWKKQCEDTKEELFKVADEKAGHEWEEAHAKAALEAARQEIVELKAKLWDLTNK
jgi:hypothetical protein